jgi:hypothetical protein
MRALHVVRREDGEGLLERLGDAPVVDDEPVGLLVIEDVRFTRAMAWSSVCSLERRVEVHDLLDGRVEAGEEHVAHDQDRERVARLAGTARCSSFRCSSEVWCRESRVVVLVRARDDDGRLRGVELVERLLVEHGRPRGSRRRSAP